MLVSVATFISAKVVSVVVVWLESTVLLHCVAVCSGSVCVEERGDSRWVYTIWSRKCFSFTSLHCHSCPDSISVSDCVSSSTASSTVEPSECCRVISCTSARNAIPDLCLHERDNDISPMPSELIFRQDVWFRDLPSSRLHQISPISTWQSGVSFCTHNAGVATYHNFPDPRRVNSFVVTMFVRCVYDLVGIQGKTEKRKFKHAHSLKAQH